MADPYDTSGLNSSSFRGRAGQLKKILGCLSKETPDQVSIIGPRYCGKSALLKQIANELVRPGSPFNAVLLWDLTSFTPSTNSEFFVAFAQKLDVCLSALGSQYHDYLQPGPNDISENIRDVIQDFGSRGQRILLILDGFDHLAREPQISKNLWDYLRALAQDGFLSYVIASRRGLLEAIPDRESRSSPFFNSFGVVEVIRPVGMVDLPEWLEPLIDKGFVIDESARKELLNWTGGSALLLARVCATLWSEPGPRAISKAEADSVCEGIGQDQWTLDHLAQLWDDCPQQVQGDVMDLVMNHATPGSFNTPRQRALLERGYLAGEGSGLRSSCRFILNFAASQSVRSRDLRELMRDEFTGLQTTRTILQLRLNSIPKTDGGFALNGYIELAVEGLKLGTSTALIAFRSIADEAVALAWAAEFPGDQVPASVQQYLTLSWDNGGGGFTPDIFHKLGDKNVRRRILNAVAGNQSKKGPAKKVSKKVSRPLMVLIDHLTEVGNFGQHVKDISPDQEAPVDTGFCIAACWSAIELLRRIGSDLS
jgi:hypothetical protein